MKNSTPIACPVCNEPLNVAHLKSSHACASLFARYAGIYMHSKRKTPLVGPGRPKGSKKPPAVKGPIWQKVSGYDSTSGALSLACGHSMWFSSERTIPNYIPCEECVFLANEAAK